MNIFRKIRQKTKKLKQEILILALALNDKQTPLVAKFMIGLTISYALSPIDLIPDFIPVLGYLDDIIILPLMIIVSIWLVPKNVLDDCREKVQSDNRLNKKLGIYAAIVIVLIWISTAVLFIYRMARKN